MAHSVAALAVGVAFAGMAGTAGALSLPPAVPGTVINTTGAVTTRPAIPITSLTPPISVVTAKPVAKPAAKPAAVKKKARKKVRAHH